MYVASRTADSVFEYNLSTAWDVSTASLVQGFSVNTEEATVRGLFFKPDGLSMYVVGNTNNTVYQYSLGGFSVAAQDTVPFGLSFKLDGTKMYVVGGSGDDINEYDLSTAWDTSTASYRTNFVVNLQETAPTGVTFKPDGTKMYVIGTSGDSVFEYDLSTAWDISTANYLQGFSVAAQDGRPYDVSFKPDGTKMYVAGINSDSVFEYDLSTAWDVSTASYLQNFSVLAQLSNPTELSFKDDGTKMYVLAYSLNGVNEYDLSTAWDISTASYLQNFLVSSQEAGPYGMYFKPDGTQMFISGIGSDRVFTYSLGVQD